MKRIVTITLFLTLAFIRAPYAIALDPPTFQVLSGATPLGVDFNNYSEERITEITPWSLENATKTGGNHLFFVSSNKTFLCDFPDNIFSSVASSTVNNCKFRQGSTINRQTLNGVYDTSLPLWRRDFYGAFSGQMFVTNQGTMIYAINHGEYVNNNHFMSLGQPCYQARDIGYGTTPCTGQPEDLSYNAFVTMSTFNFGADYYSDKLFTDLGPIVWPANGYVLNGQKATSLGILHPSSIVKDNYLYVFFRDTSLGNETEGRGPGPKVARAPITTNGVDPHSFKTYFNGEFTDWALPSGPNFNQNNIMSYFNQKGGRSSSLFADDYDPGYITKTYSLAVAKIKNHPVYLGVANDLRAGLSFRFSFDLVHWSGPTVLPEGGAASTGGPFLYAKLANSNGDSNVEIDPNDFYVIGTQNHVVNKMHLKLTSIPIVSPSPSPTPIPIPGDVTGDSHVNNDDFTTIKTNFDNPYTIFDYNTLVENWGK